jgi:cytosine/adenosine deaminase-related metal-dependent hydrolase
METMYLAKWLLTETMDLIENGAVVVVGERIISVGPRSWVKRSSAARIVNLGDALLMPGLINMHTHLDASAVRGNFRPPDETFAAWSAKISSRIKMASADQLQSSIQLTVRELIAQGVTTVVDTTRSVLSKEILQHEPVRSWVIQELFSDDIQTETTLIDNCTSMIRGRKSSWVSSGIGPYALYSLSPDAQKRVRLFAHNYNILWQTHLAESAEELQAFSEKNGDLYFHMTRKNCWPFDLAPSGPAHYALQCGLIPERAILIHCNYIAGNELEQLAARDVSIVICHTYTHATGHKHFPLDVALKRNCNICIGTEGLAPHGNLSIFDELFALKQSYPHIQAKEFLKMATINSARALNAHQEIGTISEGKYADFIAIRFAYIQGEDLLETLLVEEPEIVLSVINGDEIIAGYS